jgi:hypothetical protein
MCHCGHSHRVEALSSGPWCIAFVTALQALDTACAVAYLCWYMCAALPPLLVLQIPSDKVPFNQLPDMKAYEITEAGKEALRSGKYKMVSRGLDLGTNLSPH